MNVLEMKRTTSFMAVCILAIIALAAGDAFGQADPVETPAVSLIIPEAKTIAGALWAVPTEGNEGKPRRLPSGECKLQKGEWLQFRADNPRNYTQAVPKALAGISSRLWSADFAFLTDADLVDVAGLTELRTVSFMLAPRATGEGLVSLSKLDHLHLVAAAFYGGGEVTGLKHIAAVKSLEQLFLKFGQNSPEDALDGLAEHPALRILMLNNWSKLTDTGMSKIAKIPKLQLLGVSGCTKITSTGIAALKGLSLSSLDIGGCDRVGNEGAQAIAAMSGLQMLYAKASGITDDGIKHLGKLTKLDTLDLSDNFGVTDACLADLKKLSALKNLNLSGTELTDKAVDVLKEMQTLQSLNVESTGITAKAIADLKKALPKAKINETR
jgi:Leucine Rich repeat